MKRLSATSINDFLECPQRFWYRTNHPEASKVSDHVVFGGVVHDAIEKFDNLDEALDWSLTEWDIKSQSGNFMPDKQVKKPPKSFKRMLKNYYNVIEPEIDGGEKEVFFRLPWKGTTEEIEVLGKMDRVTDSVYDWKTGARKPSKYQLHALQFYLYAWAYEKIHGRPPKAVYYGFLNSGSIIEVDIKPILMENVESTIDYVIENMDKDPIRVVGYQCSGCFYKEICFAQLDGVWAPY
jgi:CRISPR/Cas system-associated exonuclease Cas4 (RecB family)